MSPLLAAVGISTGTISVGLQQAFSVGGPSVSMTTGPDGRFYICTLDGKIRVAENGVVTTALDLATAPVPFMSDAANGLYGVAFHPGFNDPASGGYRKCYTYADERKFVSGDSGPLTGLPDLWQPEKYTPGSPTPSVGNYAVATFDHFNVIREWTVNAAASPPTIDPASSRVLLRLAHPAYPGHNGSGPRFGPDGFLYVAVGDGGGNGNDYSGSINNATDGFTNGSGNAQDRTNPFGKLLRIDPLPGGTGGTLSSNGQYRIPAGNPFADGAGGNVDEIYAYGFRNPWGFNWDSRIGGDGRLFLANVGSHHREEINVVTSGGNFGWGYMEGSVPLIQQDNYSGENLTAAVTFHRTPPGGFAAFSSIAPLAEYKTRRQYAPDGAAAIAANLTGDGTAVTGGFVYRGTAIPALVGHYVFGDYAVSDTTPPPGFSVGQARLFYLNAAQASPSILEFVYTAGTTVPGYLLAFGQDNAGELYALFANGDVKKIVPPPTAGAPEIATAPVSQTVTAGDAASFAVTANGSGPFTYQWYLNGAAIAGATNATYIIPAAQRFQAGSFTVSVTNAAGSTSSNLVTLTVNNAPASTARLFGLSTRGFIGINDAIMISGLVISPGSPKTLLIRAIGPSLALPPYNVPGALGDTKITIYSGGTPILQNDDWGNNPDVANTIAASLQIGAYPLPGGSKDASFVVTLPSGNYTVQATAANGTSTGIALVEVYEIQ